VVGENRISAVQILSGQGFCVRAAKSHPSAAVAPAVLLD